MLKLSQNYQMKIKIIFSCILLTLLVSTMGFVQAQNRESVKPFIELQPQYNSESGAVFSIVPVINTKENNITKVDLWIGFNEEVIQVEDGETGFAGIQINSSNQFGNMIVNEVDNDNGEIHIIIDRTSNDTVATLGNIIFDVIAEGKSDIQVLNTTQIFDGGTAISYQNSIAVISQIINTFKPYRFSHIQSTFLSEENVSIPVTTSFYTDKQITEFLIQYRTMPLENESTEWKELPMTSNNNTLFSVNIPAEDVQQPGITYCFKITTSNTFLTVPRPCTLENAYQMKIVDAEALLDETPPTLTLSPPGGDFNESVEVTVTSDEEAHIYCTLDGTKPTEKDILYTEPFLIKESTKIKCFAVDEIGNRSQVYEEFYSIAGSIEIEFTGDPEVLPAAGNATLQWSVKGADTVSIDKGIGDVESEGEKVVEVKDKTTYTLTAKNDSSTKTQEVTITVGSNSNQLNMNITADKTLITPGEKVTISWIAEGVSNPIISPTIGAVAPTGTSEIFPTQNTIFVLSGTYLGQQVTDQVSVQVSLYPGATPPITGPTKNLIPFILGLITAIGILAIKVKIRYYKFTI